MAHVFISYAREDRSSAEALARILERRDWTVWWDRELPVGKPYAEAIESELEGAACVIVLWSPHSVASQWVKTEAAEGLARNILVPIQIAPTPRLPFEFRRLHTADLSGWDGETETAELRSCLKAVELLTRQPQAEAATAMPETVTTPAARPQRRYARWAALITVLVIVALLATLKSWPGREKSRDVDAGGPPKSSDVLPAPETSGTRPPAAAPGMIGAGFSPRGFVEYVKLQKFGTWRPQFIVVHHTSQPSRAQWKAMPGERRMDQMAAIFKNNGWSGGPHLFVDDSQIWVLNPLTKPGIHATGWNKISLGVEIVGDYTKETFAGGVHDNTVSALATLCAAFRLDPATIRFHSEEPHAQASGRVCPGPNVDKKALIRDVQSELARRGASPPS